MATKLDENTRNELEYKFLCAIHCLMDKDQDLFDKKLVSIDLE